MANEKFNPMNGEVISSILPIANSETIGGVIAKKKSEIESVEVAVDETGKLYVPDSGGVTMEQVESCVDQRLGVIENAAY